MINSDTNIDVSETSDNSFEMVEIVPEKVCARASFSRLEYYNTCPQAFKYKYIDKLQPLSAPKMLDENGNEKPPAWFRGTVIHQAMDDYINGVRDDLIPELYSLKPDIEEARILKKKDPKRVLTEQNKYFDEDYNIIDMDSLSEDEKSVTSGGDPCPKEYHALVIIDLLIFNEDFTEARVIDLKSGKRNGNEVKHQKQTQMYALFISIEYPNVQNFITEIWYCDLHGLTVVKDYTKEKIQVYFNYWDRCIMQMKNDTNYFSKPHEKSCFFCEWGLQEHSNKWVNKLGKCTDSKDKRYR